MKNKSTATCWNVVVANWLTCVSARFEMIFQFSKIKETARDILIHAIQFEKLKPTTIAVFCKLKTIHFGCCVLWMSRKYFSRSLWLRFPLSFFGCVVLCVCSQYKEFDRRKKCDCHGVRLRAHFCFTKSVKYTLNICPSFSNLSNYFTRKIFSGIWFPFFFTFLTQSKYQSIAAEQVTSNQKIWCKTKPHAYAHTQYDFNGNSIHFLVYVCVENAR